MGGPINILPDSKIDPTGPDPDLSKQAGDILRQQGASHRGAPPQLLDEVPGASRALRVLLGHALKEPVAVAVLSVLIALLLLLLMATMYLAAGVWEATYALRIIAEAMPQTQAKASTAGVTGI